MSDDPLQYIECPNCDYPLHPGEPCECDYAVDPECHCPCEGYGVLWYDMTDARQCPECKWFSIISVDAQDGVAYAVLTTCMHGIEEWEPCPQCEEMES